MVKKNDKRLCWNCDGTVSFELTQCPYCGVHLEDISIENQPEKPFSEPSASYTMTASDEEWNDAIDKQEEKIEASKKEKINSSLFLILPGISFSFFGLVLLFFSEDGLLTLQWKGNLAYFYLAGAATLIYLGWRSITKSGKNQL